MSNAMNSEPTQPEWMHHTSHPEHEHRPAFKLGELFKTNGRYLCQSCQEPITYAKPWNVIGKVWYYVFFAFLIYSVLNQKAPSMEAMVQNFAMIIGALLIYLAGAAFINRRGVFEIDERTIRENEARAAQRNGIAAEKSAAAAEEAAELTAEQEELQALYKHYEQLNAEQVAAENAALGLTADATEGSTDAEIAVANAQPAVACEHELAPSWKNFVPGMMEFKCAKCDAKLGFPEDLKKRINMIYMAMSLIMIIPMMNFERVSFLAFLGLTLIVLIVAGVLQYFLLKRGNLVELK